MANVNDELCQADNKGMVAAPLFGVLDLRSESLVYGNAGHHPPFLLPVHASAILLDDRHGPVVGARAVPSPMGKPRSRCCPRT